MPAAESSGPSNRTATPEKVRSFPALMVPDFTVLLGEYHLLVECWHLVP